MKLFKKEKERSTSNDVIAEKIAGSMVAKQRQLADYLNSKSNRFSRDAVLYTIISFCIAFGGYCTYLIFDAVNQ